jgi:2,4-dienoyl-CoA reductase-like NADH-dependent reductase (Old Yellow Enzyme family)/thioredoxin reductase
LVSVELKAGVKITMNGFQHLLKPLQIKSMELNNRLVIPPMTTMLANPDNSVSEANLAYVRRLAGSGAALMIGEVSAVHPQGIEGPGMLGAYDDRFIPGLSRLAEEVHRQGPKVMAQIFHVGRESLFQLQRGTAVGPSALPGIFKLMPRELSWEEIQDIVRCFGRAALRVKKAGFDGVELHAAHGYLMMQFLSEISNHREDEYGGDFRQRTRFILEVIREVRQQVGADFPVSLRISAEEYVEGGYRVDDTMDIVGLLAEAGIDMLNVSFGTQSTPGGMVCPSIDCQPGFNVHLAARIKTVTSIPVIAVGRFTRLSQAEAVLARGEADLIAFGRQHLADPKFFWNTMEGREEDSIECLACNQGCLDRLYRGESIRCAINPVTGQELIHPDRAAGEKRRVLIVGAGPAGLTAAHQAALLGHRVVLAEQEMECGGQLRMASRAPYKEAYSRWIDRLAEKTKRAGVQIRLGKRADIHFVKEQAAEVIIIAAGASSLKPDIPGIDYPHVASAWQVLAGEVELTDHTLIVGGGLVGMETADYLHDRGVSNVIVAEAGPRSPVKKSNGHGYMLHRRLREAAYLLCLDTRVVEILPTSVLLETTGQIERVTPVRQVVIAIGSASCRDLAMDLDREKIPYQLIGDAYRPRGIMEAVDEGARAAWGIK